MRNLASIGIVAAVLSACAIAPRTEIASPPRPRLGPELTAVDVDLSGRAYELPETLGKVEIHDEASPNGPVRTLGLIDAIRIATSQNLDLALARVETEIAAAGTRSARAGLFPELEGGASAWHRDGRVQGSFGDFQDVEFSTYEPTVALVYRKNFVAEVFRASTSALEEEAAHLTRMGAEQALSLRVSELYYSLLVAKVGVQIAEQLGRDNQRLVRIVSAREEAGIASGSDSARARARLARAQKDTIVARRIRDRASIRLAVALRLDPTVRLEPAEERLVPARHAGDTGWDPARSAGERPDVRAADRRARAAERARSGATWDLLAPRLTAELRQSYVSDTLDSFGGRTSYGALLLWTLSEEKLGRLGEADAGAEQARLLAERAHDQARGDVLDARQGVSAAAEQIPFAKQQLDAAERAFRISLARLRDGTGTALEVFETQDDVARARLDLAQSIVAFNQSQIRLLAAAGVLSPSTLARE